MIFSLKSVPQGIHETFYSFFSKQTSTLSTLWEDHTPQGNCNLRSDGGHHRNTYIYTLRVDGSSDENVEIYTLPVDGSSDENFD